MLAYLSIKNYAIIDSLEIDFNDGFSVLTGETGSGKSIILGALHLLMGHRVDSKSILISEKKCIVEGVFSIQNYDLKSFFYANELDYEPKETLIRREISSSGKSRAFINDSPVKASLLKVFTAHLIDIHSQHQTVLLNTSSFQLRLIDSLAEASSPKHKDLLEKYHTDFANLKTLEKDLYSVLNEGEESKNQLDYLSFLYQELEDANLVLGEKKVLENEIKLAENQEEINQILQKVHFVLESNHSSSPVNNQLSELVQDLTKISTYSSTYSDLANRLNSVALELADISKESESCLAKANDGVVDYELSSERLNLINQLEQKHRAHSFSDLLDKFEEIGTRLSKYSQIETTQKNLENSIKALNEELLKQAKVLSKNRATVTEKIEMFIVSTLVDLGMKNGQFKVDLNTRTTLHESGIDEVNFLFSANKGIELQEMSKVASGGESSRLMLAIKALLAKHLALPCLVLDEIDTGVSGEIASKIAKILTEMSKETQLIVISHLPQVAAKATTHYKVEKLDVAGKTQTNIRLLADEQRLDELAKMLSGEKISTAALENAKALMLND